MSFIKENLMIASGSDRGKINITADEIYIGDLNYMNVSLVVDLNVLGVNGRDAGVEGPNLWYAAYIIGHEDKSTIASLLSLSGTAPVLPSGYDRFKRVGWVRNNGAGDLYRFTNAADDAWFWWNETMNVAPFVVQSAGTAVTFTDVACSAVAPPTCRMIYVLAYAQDPDVFADKFIRLRANDLSNKSDDFTAAAVRGRNVDQISAFVYIGVDSSQILEYRVNVNTDEAWIVVQGYKDIR